MSVAHAFVTCSGCTQSGCVGLTTATPVGWRPLAQIRLSCMW
jgi:hypothetical protein